MDFYVAEALVALYVACGLLVAGVCARRHGGDALSPAGWAYLVLLWPHPYAVGLWVRSRAWMSPRLRDLQVRLLTRLVRFSVRRLTALGCTVSLGRPDGG